MNTKKTYKYRHFKDLGKLIIIGAIALLVSCESFVELELPDSQINATQVFNDIQTAEGAIGEIYSQIRDQSILTGNNNGIGFLMGLYTDELTNFNNSSLDRQEFYQNNVSPDNSTVERWWQNSYNIIYSCNRAIEGLSNSTQIEIQEKNYLIGEVIFLRAIIYYYLSGIFGDIPYTISTAYSENTQISRTDRDLLLNFLIDDLLRAEELLPETDITGERIFASKSTARAMLARIHLEAGNMEAAQEYSSVLINNTQFSLNVPVEAVFLKNSQSTIWQLKPAQVGTNTLDAQAYIFNMTPPPNVALSDFLVESFSEVDLRYQNWIGKIQDSIAGLYYYPFKYKLNEPGTSSEEYSIVLRIAEQYLIRAEARFALGDVEGATQDLNAVRSRAGLLPIRPDNLTKELIALEWLHEYFTEFGQRFIVLKRLKLADEILDSRKPGWNEQDKLLPVPEEELVINPNL